MPMQIPHCARVRSTIEKMRCRNPISVTRMIARSATPYRRSCVGPGMPARLKIVCTWSRASRPAARWNRDSVVRSIVEATATP